MFLLVDKPVGISSFGVIKFLKKFYIWQKIWHSGTLDPNATWLMILGIGKDTKNLETLIWLDKTYLATIDFSQMTDTWDIDYHDKHEQYEISVLQAPTIEEIQEKLDTLVPSAVLPLPAFSAKKKNGKRFYEMARKWHIMEEEKEMKIHSYKIAEYNFPILKVHFDVWSGTYIRSIAYRLWKQFSLWWILTALRRESVWTYILADYEMKSIEGSHITYCEIEN